VTLQAVHEHKVACLASAVIFPRQYPIQQTIEYETVQQDFKHAAHGLGGHFQNDFVQLSMLFWGFFK